MTINEIERKSNHAHCAWFNGDRLLTSKISVGLLQASDELCADAQQPSPAKMKKRLIAQTHEEAIQSSFPYYLPWAKNTRFSVLPGDEVVKDHLTGLMWTRNPNMTESWQHMTIDGAIAFCERLTYGGFSDWRLPYDYELWTLFDPRCLVIQECRKYHPALPWGNPFMELKPASQNSHYTRSFYERSDDSYAAIDFIYGTVTTMPNGSLGAVWPVRGIHIDINSVVRHPRTLYVNGTLVHAPDDNGPPLF